jgi:phosphoesterase RecJ-like protein
MNTLPEVLDALRSRSRWVVTSHARPDGDAVGSVLGCVQILRAMGKHADGYLGDALPFIYRSLPGAADLRPGPVDAACYDGVVVLECNNLQRTNLEGLAGLYSVSIDHHETFTEYAAVNYVVPSAAATAELLYRLAQAAPVPITPDIATCLYTAVLTDTGSFCYSCTSAETFGLARAMVLAGADPAAIAQQVYFSNPAAKMHLLGRALSHLQCHDSISWMHVSEADMLASGATEQDCEGLVNWALSIHGIEATAFFRQIDSRRYRVSLRSKGRIDVSRIAQSFGGGGHTCASGLDLDGPLEAATAQVLTALRDALHSAI